MATSARQCRPHRGNWNRSSALPRPTPACGECKHRSSPSPGLLPLVSLLFSLQLCFPSVVDQFQLSGSSLFNFGLPSLVCSHSILSPSYFASLSATPPCPHWLISLDCPICFPPGFAPLFNRLSPLLHGIISLTFLSFTIGFRKRSQRGTLRTALTSCGLLSSRQPPIQRPVRRWCGRAFSNDHALATLRAWSSGSIRWVYVVFKRVRRTFCAKLSVTALLFGEW